MLSNTVKSVVAIAGLLVVQLSMATWAHAVPEVTANQPEYTMGDTAVLYGTGFAPGANLTVEIVRVDGQIMNGDGVDSPGEHPSSDTVVADSVGAFTYLYIVDGGPASAYDGILTANVRDVANPSTVLATTTFIDGPHYLLQGCSKDRGNCNYDGSSSWAGGSNPMNGWSASSLKGWYEDDDIAFRVRVGLRDVAGSSVQYFLTEQDYRTGANFAIDYSTGFYVGAGPFVPGFTEGQLTKNCTLKGPLEEPLNEMPTVGNPCIVTGPFHTGVDEDSQGGADEDPVDGVDNDMDGRVDEDPAPNGSSDADQRIQYRWAVYFQAAETGTRDDKWALYWKGHAGAGAKNHGRIRSHSKSNYHDWDGDHDQDMDIDRCDDHDGSTGTDLRIVKTDSPDPVVAGNNLTYTLTVTNLGPNSASGVTVSDTLPANVTFVSATWGTGAPPASQTNCSMSGGTVTCNIGAMSNGASRVATIVVRPLQGGTLTNTAIVSSTSTEKAPANNTSTVTTTVTPSANLSIIKSAAPNPVLAGQNLTYTITVNNAGPSTATGVAVNDVLPATVTLVSAVSTQGTCSGTATVSCSIGTLANGASATVTIVVTPGAGAVGTLSNTATVSSSVGDPVSGNNTSTTSSSVSAAANLALTKSDSPDPVLAGQNLTYSILVTNNGPSAATGVTVSDTLPANVTLVSATSTAGTCSGNPAITCAIGTLANGASATVTIVVTPGASAVGTLSNTASVTSGVTDPNTSNNSWTTTTTVNAAANLSITKTDSPDPVLVGQNLTYTIVVTNNGPNSATGVSMTDTLPGGATWVSTMTSQGSCSGTVTVTCNLGTLANGASATVTIVVTPTAGGSLSNTASVTGAEADPVSGNNSASTSTTVSGLSANLSINKAASASSVLVGQNLTYTITVTNLGPNSATGVSVSDPLPSGATYVSATASQGSGCTGTTTVVCPLGVLGNGASATVTIVVTANAAGTLSNTATVTSGVSDPNSGNNSDTESTTVTTPLLDLAITQTAAPSPVEVGLPVTFTITVTNNGPGTATGVVVTDTLPSTPANTFNSVLPSQGSCTAPSGGTFMCSLGNISNGGSATITLILTPLAQGTLGNSASAAGNETETTTVNNFAAAAANVGDVSRLINISTRGFVGTNGDVMVGGFILGGNLPKQLLIRGIGPSLTSFGVTGVLANPRIELFADADNNPSTPAVVVATNDNWQTQVACSAPAVCGTATDIINTGLSANSYAPTNPNRGFDSALLVTLPPGSYTVRMLGVSNGTGVGLLGVDDPDTSTEPKLVNISTRGRVQTTIPMVGGFIIGAGTGSKTVLLRGFGPTLTSFGLTGVLANPTIELFYDHDFNPNTAAILLATNNDWGSQTGSCNAPAVCGTVQDIVDTGMSADDYAPTNPNRALDSGLLVTLPPGAYTMRITGVGSTSGVVLVGVDELGN